MPRSAKIVRGHRYQVGRFAGSWYVADLDQNRFVYGPFLRRETAEARLKKIVHMSRVRNPKEYYIIKTSTYPSKFLAKSLNGWILVNYENKAHHFSSWDAAANEGRKYFKSPHYGIKWMWQIEPRLIEHNPEWKPPFAKRKRKRLGVLYQKAFAKFSKENPRRRGVLIYGRVLKIFAQKTEGPYKGQQFVHTFKPGAIMMGLPDGSIKISHP